MPGSPTPDPSHGSGGLIVIMRPDPVAAARALAQELGIEVTIGGAATTEAVARLLKHADSHPSPHRAHDITDGTRPARNSGSAAAPPHLPTDAELHDLAAGMRRADARRDRTHQRVADALCQRLNSSLVIHPATLRQAATELIEATHAVTQARVGRSAGAKPTRAAQAGTVGAVGAFGAAATAVGLVVAWPAGLAMAGVGAVSGLARQRTIRRNVRRGLPNLEAAEALARRRWERVAGIGADPADLDAVIRRYDPHTNVVGDLLAHHPAVRAVQRVADDRRQSWVEAWQVAVDDPLSARSLLDRSDDDDASPPVTSSPAQDAATTTTAEIDPPSAPVILVVESPYDGLTEVEAHDLHDHLLELPADVEVIVVLGNDLLDGVDEAPASGTSGDAANPQQERIIDLTSRSVRLWSTGDQAANDHASLGASADIG